MEVDMSAAFKHIMGRNLSTTEYQEAPKRHDESMTSERMKGRKKLPLGIAGLSVERE